MGRYGNYGEDPAENEIPVSVNYDEHIKTTEKAVGVKIGDEVVWFPKSQIEAHDEVSKSLIVSEWIAKARGLK